MTMAEERCFHCEVAELERNDFKDQRIEQSIAQLLELIADWVAGYPLEDQLVAFQDIERTMMEHRNNVLRGQWKKGVAASTALQ